MTEKMAEVTKIDMYWRPVLSKTPRIIPRKNVSSIKGTVIEAASILPNRTQAKVWRNEYTLSAMSKTPQHTRGINDRRTPAKRSGHQRGFGVRPKSVLLLTLLRRSKGQRIRRQR